MKKFLYLAIIIFATIGCLKNDNNYSFTYETIVTDVPVNLEEINSGYDDYNSALPYPAFRQGIYFSTNRNSAGENFDVIYRAMDISYHSKDDVLNISHVSLSNTNDNLRQVLDVIKTDADEFGPYPYWGQSGYEYFFYANNEAENFDIKFVSVEKGNKENYSTPTTIESLNSESDDLYPSITDDGDIYFCSNRQDGLFNIYSSVFQETEIDPDFLEDNNNPIELNDILSSNGNDKCPYVFENLIVFTSDREGGYGGFDLYYSEKIDGSWSEPKNMGENVNSEFDEYRPIIIPFYEFEESMIVFSSNREGGKGGFDLYAVRTILQ